MWGRNLPNVAIISVSTGDPGSQDAGAANKGRARSPCSAVKGPHLTPSWGWSASLDQAPGGGDHREKGRGVPTVDGVACSGVGGVEVALVELAVVKLQALLSWVQVPSQHQNVTEI